jgi:HrpA-like RNA helicase
LKEIEFLLAKKFFNFYKKNGYIKRKYEGHVLVFLTGIDDILYLIDQCKGLASQKKFILLPLHGKLSFEEQSEAFNNCNDKIKVHQF